MLPIILLGLLGVAVVAARSPGSSASSSTTSIYVDKNGVPWTVYFERTHYQKWAATDKGGRYGNGPWTVGLGNADGSRQQAIAAVDFYAQEHKPVS